MARAASFNTLTIQVNHNLGVARPWHCNVPLGGSAWADTEVVFKLGKQLSKSISLDDRFHVHALCMAAYRPT